MNSCWKIAGWRRATLAITLLILVIMAGPLTQADDQQLSLASLRKVDDYPLYVMTHVGDYGFDAFLKKGLTIAQPTPGTARTGSACTCFWAAGQDGNAVFGRNFDWHDKAVLLLYTDSPTGHASVSMVSMPFDPKDLSPEEQRSFLPFAPYYPYDGMNEYGLAMALMSVPRADGGNDPQKVTIGTLSAIRLVLDYAQNVDEAVSLLQGYNISFAGGPPVHYLISDRFGRSVVVEFIGGKVEVERNVGPWQVAANNILHGYDEAQRLSDRTRYSTAWEALRIAGGQVTSEGAMEVLKSVSQGSTMWSAVYNMTAGDISIVMGRKYDQVLQFRLPTKSGGS